MGCFVPVPCFNWHAEAQHSCARLTRVGAVALSLCCAPQHREDDPTNEVDTPFDFSEENYKSVERILAKYPDNYKMVCRGFVWHISCDAVWPVGWCACWCASGVFASVLRHSGVAVSTACRCRVGWERVGGRGVSWECI